MGIGSFFTKGLKKSKPALNSPHETTNPTSNNPASNNPTFTPHRLKRTHLDELQDVFRKFDANGDGKISSTELGSIMASLGHPASEEELHSMIGEADSDGDGFIDLNEFIELNINGVDATKIVEDLTHAFMIFDVDGNGSISPKELQKVLRSLGDDCTVDDCKKMISGVDRNGDGLIDFEEFKIMMTQSLPFKLQREIEG
ncbi:probable calcium-binding protein CML25 [Magnolia sinica]|uniref:probable calcium-binding protein CML25 n=1 Tax=Magnolia sinica TaxID=86752 RepID=UPI00265B4062|nr:probable calcium-binding protein CML25 [Magnolia sinica]